MDFLRLSLVLSLCLSLVAHAVLSAPAYGNDVETADFLPELLTDMSVIRDRRDADSDNEDHFLTRIRRQVAQMASGRRGYNQGRRYRSRGRLNGRRRYNTRRHSRTRGRVVDW